MATQTPRPKNQETIAQFLARGGKIEVIQGFSMDNKTNAEKLKRSLAVNGSGSGGNWNTISG